MKRLVLALAAAAMVVLSVPANAQRISGNHIYAPGGPYYFYDNLHETYYGGWAPPYARVYVVTPRSRTSFYDVPPYGFGYLRRYRGWGRGW